MNTRSKGNGPELDRAQSPGEPSPRRTLSRRTFCEGSLAAGAALALLGACDAALDVRGDSGHHGDAPDGAVERPPVDEHSGGGWVVDEENRQVGGPGEMSSYHVYNPEGGPFGAKPGVRGERYDRDGRQWSVEVGHTEGVARPWPHGIQTSSSYSVVKGKRRFTRTLVTRETVAKDGRHLIERFQLDDTGAGLVRTDISRRLVSPATGATIAGAK